MVIVGLLLIALICLVLGLILQSAVWLVASLIATAGAAFVVFKLRAVIAASRGGSSTSGHREPELPDELARAAPVPRAVDKSAADEPAVDKSAADEPAVDKSVDVVPAAEPAAALDDDGDDVWVIDGRPRYHLGACAIIKGQDAEPIPYGQATEDGFMPCSLCEPHATPARGAAS